MTVRMAASGDFQQSSVPGAPSEEEHRRAHDLMARARAGETQALHTLLASHADRLRRIVRVRLGAGLRRWFDSEDVVQETYRAALASLEQLQVEGEAELVAWLARIATNRIRDMHDALHAQRRDADRAMALGPLELAVDQTTPSEDAWRTELAEIVDRALLELQPEHRESILLRDYCGSSWPDIATTLGSPSVHAAQQLHQRAWIHLRRLVEPHLR